ncbi:MAG: CaiB/BaiF CoA-transferase family protein [Actinomycetota bacterium]|nr:CaiB/BaiF CoA-transferase family protein [Actinomycetota bacterium]
MTGDPLAEVRVLDLTRLLPGGVLSALLADLGADVVKVEEPTVGDYMRWGEPRIGPESAASWIVGRGKRSVALDLKSPAGVSAFLRLAATVDVIIEGFRPGVVDRLGVGYDAVRAVNPRVVYASLSGYGSDGPLRDVAGHDLNYIAYAGVLGITGTRRGEAAIPGVQVGDLGGATILGMGILAALVHAARTGAGSRVEVSMYDAALAWTSIHAGDYFASGASTGPGSMPLNGLLPCYNVYRCSDGRYLSVGALEPAFWAAFCGTLGRADLVDRAYDPTAVDEVAVALASRTRDGWIAEFAGVDACVAPVLDLGEALDHPLARARGMVQDGQVAHGSDSTARTLGTPIRIDGAVRPIGPPPPALGEHTREVLVAAGLADTEVDGLIASGVAVDRAVPR